MYLVGIIKNKKTPHTAFNTLCREPLVSQSATDLFNKLIISYTVTVKMSTSFLDNIELFIISNHSTPYTNSPPYYRKYREIVISLKYLIQMQNHSQIGNFIINYLDTIRRFA